jgi:hypothetical protein
MNATNAKPLFVISYCLPIEYDREQKREVWAKYATQESIDNYNKYRCCAVEVLTQKPAPKEWPEGVVVENLGGSDRGYRCYAEVDYKVTSPVELTEDDFDILRAQGCFMSGQEHGSVCGHKVNDDGTHEYRCRSICDSSD